MNYGIDAAIQIEKTNKTNRKLAWSFDGDEHDDAGDGDGECGGDDSDDGDGDEYDDDFFMRRRRLYLYMVHASLPSRAVLGPNGPA